VSGVCRGTVVPAAFIDAQATVWNLVFSPDSSTLLTGQSNTLARTWNPYTAAPIATYPDPSAREVYGVAYDPTGSFFFTGAGSTLRKWSTATGLQVASWFHTNGVDVFDVDISSDGALAVSGASDHKAKIWNFATGAPELQVLQQNGQARAVDFSPDGSLVVVGVRSDKATLWNVATGGWVRDFTYPGQGQVFAVEISPNGLLLATGSSDWKAMIWNLNTGAIVHTLVGHTDIIWGVAFSPDGTKLVTSSEDKKVNLWNVATGALVTTLAYHSHPIRSIAFAPDGLHFASAGTNGRVAVWNLAAVVQGNHFSVEGRHNTITEFRMGGCPEDCHTDLTDICDNATKQCMCGPSPPCAAPQHCHNGQCSTVSTTALRHDLMSVHRVWVTAGALLILFLILFALLHLNLKRSSKKVIEAHCDVENIEVNFNKN
jgi:WD40 repeat protein